MSLIHDITRFLEHNRSAAFLAVAAVCALLILITLYLAASVISLKRRYAFLLRHEQTQDLGDVFAEHDKQIEAVRRELSDHSKALEALAAATLKCVQRIGVVRYDAFDDVGGQQSYAVAMLDGQDNGVVFSSIYTRHDTRTYAKAITAGKAGHNLSEEEEKAVSAAREGVPIGAGAPK